MKAYMVFDHDPMEGCFLVYAETASKAKNKGFRKWPGDTEYIYMCAHRKPEYDQFYTEGSTPEVIQDNGDLPEGAQLFFSEIEL